MDEENWHVWGRSDNGKAARNWVTLSLSAQFHMHYSITSHDHFTESFFSLWATLPCACPYN